MKIALASDHRGEDLRLAIRGHLRTKHGLELVDLGHHPSDGEKSDYPDHAQRVANHITEYNYDRGILVCGSGIGICMAANRFTGIRAATCRDIEDVRMTRLHNDANVLCIGADRTDRDTALKMVDFFFTVHFEGDRHQKRIDMMDNHGSRARQPFRKMHPLQGAQ